MGMPTMPQTVAQMERHSQTTHVCFSCQRFRVDFHYKLRLFTIEAKNWANEDRKYFHKI